MSFEIGTATSYTDLLDKLNTFLLKGHTLPPVYTGTGTGTITGAIGTASSVFETITITLTSSKAFSVSGSVTGSMGTGTVGTLFTHARASFTVNAGGSAWVAGDTISIVMTPPWVSDRATAGTEYIWHAPGDGNADAIYVGASVFSNVSADYFNWRLGGFTGYASAKTFANQPGAMTRPILPLWNASIPYWFVARGKVVIVIAKISTVYESAYLGFLDTYPSPGQWAYPLMVGGTMAWDPEPVATSTNWRWSYVGDAHHAFFKGRPADSSDDKSSLRMRRPDGLWRGFGTISAGASLQLYPGSIWPYTTGFSDLRTNLDGSYPLLPVILTEDTGSITNTFGELCGMKAVTGHLNASENIITIGRDSWLVVQNSSRTTKTDYAAVLLA